MTKIGIIGSRRRDNFKALEACKKMFFSIYKKGDSIVSGGCPKGGDKYAEIIATENNIPITIYPADWNKHGKAAGFIRNTDIARDSDIIIAIVSSDRTGGTEDTIKKALSLGKEIRIIEPIENENDIEFMMI